MGLLTWLFGKRKKKPKPPKIIFSVEYYPLSMLYYPKYKNYYMKHYHWTRIIELEDNITFGKYFNTEAEAWRYIEQFKEQRLKKNVQTITKPG